MKARVLDALFRIGIIPIVRVASEEMAVRISGVLLEAGMGTVEIPFTNPAAPRIIEALRKRYPDAIIGAGTILDEASARAAVNAGAQYMISAGLVGSMIKTAHRYGLPAIPGVMTPTEAVLALEQGADVLKLFPASALGPSYLKALRAPLPQARWCPTGGVDSTNLHEWVNAGADLVGVGSPLLKDVSSTGDFSALAKRARRFVETWRQAKT
ncbi:MAG: bifunctional 4-hydroxy-2-oxoglutarate aldolase/2-dehydro-3-deoxy-phosphogluconate aldolase [Firmicutes bacterium]|nr:bifunctional 4-hydroxy-2-oxoglutarate aldolase/2-dehydro-3-deoxy-phosphogluconate aldolase [Bacillota bacterium]